MISRRSLLLLPAFLSLAGCAAVTVPAGFAPDKVKLPILRPDFREPLTLTADQLITLTFAEAAVAKGAPASVPELRAMLVIKGDSLDMALIALNVSVWRIHASPDGIQESRHRLLDGRLQAEPMLRDLVFCLWPEASLRAQLDADPNGPWSLSVSENRRELAKGTTRMIEMTQTGSVMTLVNHPEGYSLRIETRVESEP